MARQWLLLSSLMCTISKPIIMINTVTHLEHSGREPGAGIPLAGWAGSGVHPCSCRSREGTDTREPSSVFFFVKWCTPNWRA